MEQKIKSKIKKYAGIIWIVSVIMMFVTVYILCDGIMYIIGVNSNGLNVIAVNIASISAVCTYIVLAILGMRHL